MSKLLALKTGFLIFLISFSLQAMDSRNRVEELFIWKISDELKLSVPEEKSFSDLVRGLNQKRSKINESLQDVLKKMANDGLALKDKEKLIGEHRKLLKAYNDVSLEEADKIQKLFGTDKTAKYFVLKNDLTNRLKSLLATSEKKPSVEKLAPPQVIEEK